MLEILREKVQKGRALAIGAGACGCGAGAHFMAHPCVEHAIAALVAVGLSLLLGAKFALREREDKAEKRQCRHQCAGHECCRALAQGSRSKALTAVKNSRGRGQTPRACVGLPTCCLSRCLRIKNLGN